MSDSMPIARRVPAAWWVLVPGVLLALAGARAVDAEMDRAQDDARERAAMAASRVARAFGTLVTEYAAPLPGPDETVSHDAAIEATRHFYPAWLRDDVGNAVTGEARVTTSPEARAVEASVVAAATERAAAADTNDTVAAAVLAGAAAAVESPEFAAALLVAAAGRDVAAGEPWRAVDELARVLELPPGDAGKSAALDGARLSAARALVDVLRLTEGRSAPDGALLRRLVQRLVGAAWVPGDERWALAGAIVGFADGELADELRSLVETERSFRERLDRSRGERAPLVAFTLGHDVVVLGRTRLADGHGGSSPVRIGGALPVSTLRDRIAAEVSAVATELGAAVVLRGPDGRLGDLDVPDAAVVAVADVSGALRGWSAEARVTRPTGLPTSALVLAAAVLVATLALSIGAVLLARAVRYHARLAEERRSFLDHVAHEVRTPATSLLALSEELQRGHVAHDRVAVYHEHLGREARRLADLVEETLDLARLEGGRLVGKREPVDIRAVVLEAVDSAGAEAASVSVALPDDPAMASADRSALRRAIRNLVDNARKHGASERPVEVALTLDAADGAVVLTVRDHGHGIPEAHVARVFERFHRVPSATHEVKGVGLGLALVREVAEAHQGSASARNAPGGGAEFALRLPMLRGPRGAEGDT